MLEREQFRVLVKVMKSVYTSQNFIPDKDAFDVWYELLKDVPYKVLDVAVKKYILTQHYEPKPADIRALCIDATKGIEADFGQGWQQVAKAIHTYGMYQEQEALQSFDDLTRQCVERLGWKQLCLSEKPDNDRANFRMLYEQIQQKQRTDLQLPQNVKQQITAIQEKCKPKLEVRNTDQIKIEEKEPYEAVTDIEQINDIMTKLSKKLGG